MFHCKRYYNKTSTYVLYFFVNILIIFLGIPIAQGNNDSWERPPRTTHNKNIVKINDSIKVSTSNSAKGAIGSIHQKDKLTYDSLNQTINIKQAPTPQNNSIAVGNITNNNNTQVNINSGNSIQIINNIRAMKSNPRVNTMQNGDTFITQIIVEQTNGIWNQGTKFALGLQLSAPYLSWRFIKGFDGMFFNVKMRDIPGKGVIYFETMTAPQDGNIIIEIISKFPEIIDDFVFEPTENK
jgi:hypothetical protein